MQPLSPNPFPPPSHPISNPNPTRCYAIAAEERAALAHKASSYCAKLLKRADQCQAVLACSHLHWQPQKEVRPGAGAGREGGQDADGMAAAHSGQRRRAVRAPC